MSNISLIYAEPGCDTVYYLGSVSNDSETSVRKLLDVAGLDEGGIKAFTAAVIGGIGSIPGAMIGGILLGVIEKLALSVPALAPYTTAIEFGLLIVILLFKPTGLLGKKTREKV